MPSFTFTIGDGTTTPKVEITITENGDGSFTFALSQIGSGTDGAWQAGDLKGELRGLFFDVDGNVALTNASLADLTLDEGFKAYSGDLAYAVTTGGSGENDVTGFSVKGYNDVNMNGSGTPTDGGYDVGIAFGTSGVGSKGDDVQAVSFTLSGLTGFTLADFGNQDFGLRLMSVGTVDADGNIIGVRSDSFKLVGTSDHVPAALQVDDVTVTEGDDAYAIFTVSLSNASSGDISFDIAHVDGTAGSSDYGPGSEIWNGLAWVPASSWTIPAGDTSVQVRVAIQDDTVYELEENFTLKVTATAGPASNAEATGTGTITDDDPAPSFAIDDVTVSEADGTITFTVTKTGATAVDATVDYAVNPGTADTPGDYSGTLGGTLTFLPGETTKSITLNITDDSIFELTEQFTVDLSGAVNATIADAQGVGTITDNDPAPSFAIDDVTVSEADGTITFTVTKSGATAVNATVDYAVNPGTAGTPGDYSGTLGGTLTFLPGDTTKSITLNITDDSIFELTEQFTVDLSGATNATISDAQGVGTITDNDPAPSFAIDDVTVSEADGTITFTVTKSGATAVDATVDYAVNPGTAGTPGDYSGTLGGTLTFLPGDTTKSITLNITDDSIFELTEQFTVDLSNAGNATISDAQGVGTITDDDPAPVLRQAPTDIRLNVTGPLVANSMNFNFLAGLQATDADSGAFTFSFNEAGDPLTKTIAGTLFTINNTTSALSSGNLSQNTTYDLALKVTQAGDSPGMAYTESFKIVTGSNANTADTLTSSTGEDVLYGGQGDDVLIGLSGNDTLFGHSGNDRLIGGEGNDFLYGGTGDDQFRFLAPADNGRDTLVDFQVAGGDVIALLQGGGGWNAAGSAGNAAGQPLAAADYVNRTAITDIAAGDTNKVVEIQTALTLAQIQTGVGQASNAYALVFNSDTGRGELWHDADWSDAAGRSHLATFDALDSLVALQAMSSSEFVEWA